ncbi:uncharacterized protein [Dermacentor andersoni]|uniref:uncharacterized protein isoform X9 n=1 Tax=Dermacentor andersoni TaxID=34620 RepID=UPI0024169E27|nr:uncharacterized protein LOC126520319 isoform X11 [Dermacentor andersoni]XP_054923002.1 uncharacterized protein LOC126524009 isoform X2 [Dermacentor andersoni]XP_054923212.1 uncharacterized protein LOC126524295 isoform X8 [Dermacentor andersoni]
MCRLAICASRTSTIVLSRTGFVDAGSEHALHQAYLLLPPAVCPAGFIGQNKSQEAVPRALHWDHLTSTVTSTETSWHPDKSSSLFDVPFSGLGSTERARMLIKFFLIAQRPSRASEKSLRYWREQTGFTELCFMSRWADTMSPDAVTLCDLNETAHETAQDLTHRVSPDSLSAGWASECDPLVTTISPSITS